jgi:hypothetical protein
MIPVKTEKFHFLFLIRVAASMNPQQFDLIPGLEEPSPFPDKLKQILDEIISIKLINLSLSRCQ